MDQESFSSFLEKRPSFSLVNFEGPLELLLYLIQKDELDIRMVPMREITLQFLNEIKNSLSVDHGAEFLAAASTMLLMKSRKLLPQESEKEEEIDARFEIFAQLIEYCHYKEVARHLTVAEDRESIFFPRGTIALGKKMPLGLEEMSLKGLAETLENLLIRAKSSPAYVTGDLWHVEEKILWFRELFSSKSEILFSDVFNLKKSREELIVCFLALLELMKTQEINLVACGQEWTICKKEFYHNNRGTL
jgi:segregation and condensation protein A